MIVCYLRAISPSGKKGGRGEVEVKVEEAKRVDQGTVPAERGLGAPPRPGYRDSS